MGSKVLFGFVIGLVLLPGSAFCLNVDLRRTGYPMEKVRHGNQYGSTCYAESAAMAMDAFRYSWIGSPTNTYTDAIYLTLLSRKYNGPSFFTDDPELPPPPKEDGTFDPSLLTILVHGGITSQVIEFGLEHRFCINVDQTHSILTRFGVEYDPLNSFRSLYSVYNHYLDGNWELMKEDFDKPFVAVQDGVIVKKNYDYYNKMFNVEQSMNNQKTQKRTEVFTRKLLPDQFPQSFTVKDRNDYQAFIMDLFQMTSKSYDRLAPLDFLNKLTTKSCNLQGQPNQSEATTINYYLNEDESTIGSDEEKTKKRNLIYRYFKMAQKNPLVQPLILSYCVDQALENDPKTCGHHASLILGILPNKNGTHDLILRNTDDCSPYYNSEKITCSKDGDYYVEENHFLKSIRGLFSIVPIVSEFEVDRTDLPIGLKNKLTLGWNYMVQAKQMEIQ